MIACRRSVIIAVIPLEQMQLHTDFLLDLLQQRGVRTLVHANTAVTTTHFITHQALLSRESVEHLGLCQTAQRSDAVDPVVGVWNDVFVDSVDIHTQGGVRNVYGPIVLEFDVEILRQACNGSMWVTKSNPEGWVGVADVERWFQSNEEITEGFNVNTFCQMFVFRDCNGELPFGDHLQQVTVDCPNRTINGVNAHDAAVDLLQTALTNSGLDVPIIKRNCRAGCRCGLAYPYISAPEIQSLFMTCP